MSEKKAAQSTHRWFYFCAIYGAITANNLVIRQLELSVSYSITVISTKYKES